MIEVRADATLPVGPAIAFAEATDPQRSDWLPAVRGMRLLPGPAGGLGARYAVEVGLVGRHMSGVLVCREWRPPERAEMVLEEGFDLTITLLTRPVAGGCVLELIARYSVGGGLLGGGVEKASAGAARREVGRAVEQLAARFARAG